MSAGRGSVDPDGILLRGFTLTSFAMALLLALRLNRTYERWKDAKVSITGVVSQSWNRVGPRVSQGLQKLPSQVDGMK